jgi:tRNA-Thr(GGU) m(6)t(6)A37 methyltransferase TsaA
VELSIRPIGVVRSPYPERFGIPRQGGLAPARCTIELDAEVVDAACTRGLEGCTHIWVLFWFHAIEPVAHATVRPPRLGGESRIGVLATRSPHRPVPIGMTAVRLVAVDGLRVEVEGGDFLDGTPVLDLKPYLPDVDRIEHADVVWTEAAFPVLEVEIEPGAAAAIAAHPRADELLALVRAGLTADPRPAYRRRGDDAHRYGMALLDVDVRFRVEEGRAIVESVVPR